jgi:hypothetical protein
MGLKVAISSAETTKGNEALLAAGLRKSKASYKLIVLRPLGHYTPYHLPYNSCSNPSASLSIKKPLRKLAFSRTKGDLMHLQGLKIINPALTLDVCPFAVTRLSLALHDDRQITVSFLDRRQGREELGSIIARKGSYDLRSCSVRPSKSPRRREGSWHYLPFGHLTSYLRKLGAEPPNPDKSAQRVALNSCRSRQ